MEIDIIAYSDEQYAALTEEQLRAVYEAQEKKNRLTWRLEEDKQTEKDRLVKNGIFLSGLWEQYCEKLQTEYEREVESVRDALLFYLRFTMKSDEIAPYVVNYALTEFERTQIVKQYYEETYADANERFAAFEADQVAVRYLGEFYSPLWDYFYQQTQ